MIHCMATISVHIVTWNSAVWIAGCIQAIQAQTFTDYSLLVIDNASKDDTLAHIPPYVPVQIMPSNIGFAAAHNYAIRATDSSFILTLNPDVWLLPDFLQSMLYAISLDERIGSVSGQLIQVDSFAGLPSTPPDHPRIDSTGLYMDANRRQGLRYHGQSVNGEVAGPIFGVDGAAAFYRRSMLQDIAHEGQFFDELFHSHKEDVDVAWRAQLRGWNAWYNPEAVAYHVRHFRPGQRRLVEAEIKRRAVRNRWYLLIKNELPATFWEDLSAILVYDLFILAYILVQEPYSLRAIGDLIRDLSHLRMRRKQVQSRRLVGAAEMRKWLRGIKW
jgi:GT2 family glycosyltransferase